MKEQFGDLIKRIRTENGLSIDDVAQASGLTSAEIRNIEKNRTRPRVYFLKKLSDALNCDYYFLFEKLEEK